MRKSLAAWVTQLAGGLLVEKLIYFKVMLNIFEFSQLWENEESCLVYLNKLFLIARSYFLTDRINWS